MKRLILLINVQKMNASISTLLKKNKAVIRFLLVFFGTYIIFALLYKLYLFLSVPSTLYYPDFITHIVAVQSEELMRFLGYDSFILPANLYTDDAPLSMRIGMGEISIVQVVEGCNAVSVIILFLSFILAFYAGFKKTFLYILAGSVIIYTLNVIRIALLTIGIYHYPKYTDFMHGTLFPLFIYGVVFLLWIFWVRKYDVKK